MSAKDMCLFAYTQHGDGRPFPGYVNLTHLDGDSHPTLTVRTPGLNGTRSASCPVPDDQLALLRDEITKYLAGKEAVKADDDERDSA